MAYRNYSVANGFTVDPAGNGDFKTIAAALTAASSRGGSGRIILMPGTYSENPALVAGWNIESFVGDGITPTVTISGTCSFSSVGTVCISGVRLASNGAEFLTVTGSAASVVNLYNCYLTTAFDPGITYSSSSSSSGITISYCRCDISASAKKFFAHSSAGTLNIIHSICTNSGASTTASTCSSGVIGCLFSQIAFPITTSSTGVFSGNETSFNTGAFNTTPVTCGGGTSSGILCDFNGGTASALSVGGTLGLTQCTIGSSNTNAVTGAGTLTYSNIAFSSTSSKINVTTQTGGVGYGGVVQAPSAGFIGERIENTATSVAMTSNTPKTVTSISLTAGVWDVSGLAATIATGGTALAQAFVVNISTTDNTVVGTAGIQTFQTNVAATVLSGSVPAYRVTLTATTTYYLVCNVVYTSTTAPTNGRLSATRVG